MISFSSSRARESFDPPRTVLVVNKENQKNFRRMLTHPPAAGGHNLGARATLSKAETTLTKHPTGAWTGETTFRYGSLYPSLCSLFHTPHAVGKKRKERNRTPYHERKEEKGKKKRERERERGSEVKRVK